MHHHLSLSKVLRSVSLKKLDAKLHKALGDGALGHIGAAHPVALAHQKLRQAAHADAADADEMVKMVKNVSHSNFTRPTHNEAGC